MRKIYFLMAVLMMAVTSAWASIIPTGKLTIKGLDDKSVTIAHDEDNIATVVLERGEDGSITQMTISMPEQYQMVLIQLYSNGYSWCTSDNGEVYSSEGCLQIGDFVEGIPSVTCQVSKDRLTSIVVIYEDRSKYDRAVFFMEEGTNDYVKGGASAVFDNKDNCTISVGKDLNISVEPGYAITYVEFDHDSNKLADVTVSAGTLQSNSISDIPENTTSITMSTTGGDHKFYVIEVYYSKPPVPDPIALIIEGEVTTECHDVNELLSKYEGSGLISDDVYLKLLDDITLPDDECLYTKADVVTVDLNGHNIIGNYSNGYILGGMVTFSIIGEGIVENTADFGISFRIGGTSEIYGGTFIAKSYACRIMPGPELTIYGGKYKAEKLYENEDRPIIKGGLFSMDPSDCIAKGYEVLTNTDEETKEDYPYLVAAMVAIDETNFEDEIFRKYVKENFDTDNDDFLNRQEILAVDNINVADLDITSLKGIEHFSALVYLNCSSNNLTLFDLSHNTALQVLDCSYNKNLSEINTSNNLELTSLFCYFTKVSNLDLSNNTNLENLNCDYTQLTSVDVSKNMKLTFLSINNIDLSENGIDVSNNTLLKDLKCRSTNIKKLDVSKNIALNILECPSNANLTELSVSTNTALQTLRCSNCSLTSLNISNNTMLEYLYCQYNNISELNTNNNINLSYIDCSHNKLTEIDLSKNLYLEDFKCNTNKLTTLDVSNNTALESLYCSDNELTALDLKNNTILDDFECSNNHLTSLDLSNTIISWAEMEGQEIDLGTVSASGFTIEGVDMSRVSEVTGGSIVEGKFVPDEDATEMTYNYDPKSPKCNDVMEVKLTFKIQATTTAIESVNADKSQKAIKTLENGKVIIIRDNKKYDITGRGL